MNMKDIFAMVNSLKSNSPNNSLQIKFAFGNNRPRISRHIHQYNSYIHTVHTYSTDIQDYVK